MSTAYTIIGFAFLAIAFIAVYMMAIVLLKYRPRRGKSVSWRMLNDLQEAMSQLNDQHERLSQLEDKFISLSADFLDSVKEYTALLDRLEITGLSKVPVDSTEQRVKEEPTVKNPFLMPGVVYIGRENILEKWQSGGYANFEHWEVFNSEGQTVTSFTGLSPEVSEWAFKPLLTNLVPGRYRIRFFRRDDPSSNYREIGTFRFEV